MISPFHICVNSVQDKNGYNLENQVSKSLNVPLHF